MDESTNPDYISTTRRPVENKTRKIDDYTLNRVIGTGTFGRVYFANLKENQYAIKVLSKKKIIELE